MHAKVLFFNIGLVKIVDPDAGFRGVRCTVAHGSSPAWLWHTLLLEADDVHRIRRIGARASLASIGSCGCGGCGCDCGCSTCTTCTQPASVCTTCVQTASACTIGMQPIPGCITCTQPARKGVLYIHVGRKPGFHATVAKSADVWHCIGDGIEMGETIESKIVGLE